MKNKSMTYSTSDMPLNNTQQENQKTIINNIKNDSRLSLYSSFMLFSKKQFKSSQYSAFNDIVNILLI